MNTRSFYSLGLALLVLIPCISCYSAPKIEVIGFAVHDFGKYPASEQKSATFVIRNAGDEILKIVKVRKTCGCSSASADCTEVKPGQTCKVHVSIHAGSVSGQYAKKVYVESTDPKKRFLKLVVKGQAVQLVEVRPRSQVYVGRLPLNNEWKQTFQLREHLGEVGYGEPVVESTYPVDVALGSKRGTNSYRSLDVTLRPPTTSGDWRCAIRLPVLEPPNQKPIEVKLTGTLGSTLFALPSQLKVTRSGEHAAAQVKLRLASPTDTQLNSELLQWPQIQGVQWRASETEKQNIVNVFVTLSPEFFVRIREKDKVVMEIGYPDAVKAALTCTFPD